MLRSLWLAGLLAPAVLQAAGAITLNITNPSGLAVTRHPVTTGVPFPEGALASDQQVRLLDERGTELPLQAACTGEHRDGSVKWLLLDFPADIPAEGRRLALEWGEGVQRIPAPEPLIIGETDGALTVNTGPLQVSFSKSRCNGFSAVTLDGVPVVAAGHSGGAYFVTDEGEVFRASEDAAPTVQVESVGPLRSVITTRGWYTSAAGDRKCQFTLRYHFYAGQATVRIMHTWLMTEDSRTLRFRDIGFSVPVGAESCEFVMEDGTALAAAPTEGSPAGLVQYDFDKYRLLDGTAAGDSQPLGLVLTRGPQAACALAVTDFRPLFPKELTVSPTSLDFHMWPAHGVANPDRKIEDANLQYIWYAHEGEVLDFQAPEAFYSHQEGLSENDYRYLRSAQNANAIGVAKTHELLVSFGKPEAAFGEASIRRARLLQEPPACMADPKWMCDSGVFGAMQPYSPEQFPRYEKLISDNYDAERRMEAFTRDYGMWNWGDSHTSWNTTTRRWADAYRVWRNTHHGAPRVPWLLYFRSGDPKYLRYAVRNSRHVLDVDFCHYSTPEFEALDYPKGKLKGALNDYKGIVHWHSGNRLTDYNSMTDFAIWYTHMTGDPWGLEVAKDWGEAVKAKFTSPFGSRSGTGTMSALIDLYTETWDESYRPIIEAFSTHLTTKVQDWEGKAVYSDHVLAYWPQYKDQKTGIGAFPEWENYAPWIERYWDLTHSEAAKRSLVAWADAYLQGYGDMTSLWDTREYMNILAYAYLATGDPKYLGRGVWELDRIGASVYRGDDPLLQGLIMVGQVSLSGYIIQRLPAFMKALAEYGQPVAPDPLLKSTTGFQLPFERTRPTKDGKPTKIETVECLILDAADAAFTLTAHTTHTYPERWYEVTALAPDGTVISHSEERVPTGLRDFVVQVPADGQRGVYRLRVAGEGSMGRVMAPLSVTPELPVAFPVQGRLVPFMDARHFLHMPAGAREVQVSFEPVNQGAVSVQATAPDRATKVTAAELEGRPGAALTLKPTPEQTGQPWELITSGGVGAVRITVDGQAAPQVLFAAPYPADICEALSDAVR